MMSAEKLGESREEIEAAKVHELERLRRVERLARKFMNESQADLAVRYADPASAYQDLHDALFPNPAGFTP